MTKPSVFDVHSKNYRDTHDQYLPKGVKHDQFRVQKLEWVSSFVGGSLLDFGCNAGELCLDLSQIKPEMKIFGVDEAQESIRVAEENCQNLSNKPTFFHSLKQIPETTKFDLITVFNVLHHINPSERNAVLQEIMKRLAPGGRLLIWEHNPWNPVTRYLVKICPFDEGVKLVRAPWLIHVLQTSGLKIHQFEFVNVIPPSMHKKAGLRWIETFFNRVPIGAQYRLIAG